MSVRYVIAGISFIAALATYSWWQRGKMVDALPARVVCSGQQEAKEMAGGGAVAVLGTGSMAPFIPSGDPKAVVAYAKPGAGSYSSVKKGDLVVYYAKWAGGFVIHQAVSKDSGGWIMSGLNNSRSESFARVGPSEFLFIVSEVYVWNVDK